MNFMESDTTLEKLEYDWWEKSVEYLFVAQAIVNDWVDLFCPLAGTPEKAVGDLILKSDSKLFLVEFKVDHSACMSEKEKYKDYTDAEKVMKALPGSTCHLLVYGSVDRKLPGKPRNASLSLNAKPYWSKKQGNRICKFPLADMEPVSNEDFKSYLENLANTRAVDGGATSGSSGNCSVSMTVAVLASGQTVALSLPEYVKIALTPPAPLGGTPSALKGGPPV